MKKRILLALLLFILQEYEEMAIPINYLNASGIQEMDPKALTMPLQILSLKLMILALWKEYWTI